MQMRGAPGAYGMTAARSAARNCCARRATSGTGRSRGSRRSAGARRCGRTPASAGGRCALLAAAAGLVAVAVALRARRDEGAGLVRRGPGRQRRPRAHASARPRAPAPARRADRLERGAVPQRRVDRPNRPGRREPRRRQRRARRVLRQRRRRHRRPVLRGLDAEHGADRGGLGIQATLRMRSEEASGRLEPLLATAVDRPPGRARTSWSRWSGASWCSGRTGWAPGSRTRSTATTGARCAAARRGLAPAPAVWVLVGVAVALFGLVPRAALAAWGALGACFLLSLLGPLLGLPDWMLDLSPFPARAGAAGRGLRRGAVARPLGRRRRARRGRARRVPPPRPGALRPRCSVGPWPGTPTTRPGNRNEPGSPGSRRCGIPARRRCSRTSTGARAGLPRDRGRRRHARGVARRARARRCWRRISIRASSSRSPARRSRCACTTSRRGRRSATRSTSCTHGSSSSTSPTRTARWRTWRPRCGPAGRSSSRTSTGAGSAPTRPTR